MANIIVNIYLAIGGLFAMFMLWFSGNRRYRAAENPIDQIVGIASFRHSYGSGVTKRARWLLVTLAGIPGTVVLWPAILYLGAKLGSQSYRGRLATLRLLPSNLLASAGLLLTTFILVIFGLIGTSGEWGEILSVSILVALAADLISYVALGADLPLIVRRYKINPYLHFALIAAADYLILLLNAVLLRHDGDLHGLTTRSLLDQAAELATFSRFLYTVTHFPKVPAEALVAICGLLYFASIVKLIVQFRQFRRRPDDYAALTLGAVWQGDFVTARRWLERVAPTDLGDPALITPRILTHLGHNEYDAAYSLVELRYAMTPSGTGLSYSTRTPDDYLAMLFSTALISMELDPQQYGQFITYACGKGITDGCLYDSLKALVINRRITLEDVDGTELRGVTVDRYPLTNCWMRWQLADDYKAELSALDQIVELSPSIVTDRLYREILLIDIKQYHNFDIADQIRAVLEILNSGEKLPAWCRVNLIHMVDAMSSTATISDNLRVKLYLAQEKLTAGANKDELARLEALRGAGKVVAQSR